MVLGVWPVPEIARHIPVIKSGNHLRVVFIMMLCLALLAGWGLDELTERVPPRRDVVLALALGLLVLPVLILLVRDDLTRHAVGDALKVFANRSWPAPPPDTHGLHTIRMAALIAWLVFMGLALLLLVARLRWRLGATAFVALACLLVVADLFKAGMGATPAIDSATAKQPSTPGIEYLRSRGLTASSGWSGHSDRRRSCPTWRCAGASTTRAATTSRWSAATTGCGGAPCTRAARPTPPRRA